jgi:hypothetical protein
VSAPVALASLPLLLATASPATSDPPVIVLEGPPDVLAALAAAGPIAGTVMPGDGQGALVLLTALGALSIKNAIGLAAGTRLVLQPVPDQPGTVLVVAVNDVATSSPAAPTAPLQTAAPSPATPPAVLDLGTTVTATVLAPGGEPSAEPDATPAPMASATPSLPLAPSRPGGVPAAAAATVTTAPPALPLVDGSPRSPAPAAAAVPAQTRPPAIATAPAPAGLPLPINSGKAASLLAETVATVPMPTLGAPSDKAPSPASGETVRLLPPGTNLAVRILAVQPPPTSEGTTQPALTGTVIAAPRGERALLVATPAGIVRLFAAAAPTAGKPAALPFVSGTPVALRLVAEAPAGGVLTVLRSQAPAAANAAPATPTAAVAVPERAAPATSAAGAAPALPEQAQGPVAPSAAAAKAAAGATKAASAPLEGEPMQAAPLAYRVTLADVSAAKPVAGAPPDPRGASQPVIGTVLPNRPATAATATLIATPRGTLAVSEPLALPPGTLLLLVPQDDASDPAIPGLERPSRLDKGWPALEASLGTLGLVAPQLSAHLRTDLSAQSGEHLASGLMFLVAALQSGSSRAWPGEAIEHALALAGRSDLKLRLGEEFAEIRGIANNPATGAWQVFLLPLIEGAAVRPVRLYLKRRGERGRRAASEDNARFILEFELTRLGMLQLDGLVRPQRFDLVLRSHSALDAPLRAGVERIFYQRVGAAGLAGTIDFATALKFDIAPLDKLRGAVGLAV